MNWYTIYRYMFIIYIYIYIYIQICAQYMVRFQIPFVLNAHKSYLPTCIYDPAYMVNNLRLENVPAHWMLSVPVVEWDDNTLPLSVFEIILF